MFGQWLCKRNLQDEVGLAMEHLPKKKKNSLRENPPKRKFHNFASFRHIATISYENPGSFFLPI